MNEQISDIQSRLKSIEQKVDDRFKTIEQKVDRLQGSIEKLINDLPSADSQQRTVVEGRRPSFHDTDVIRKFINTDVIRKFITKWNKQFLLLVALAVVHFICSSALLSNFGPWKWYICSRKNHLYTRQGCWSHDLAKKSPRVVVMGETKAGKSTFLNVLMGNKLVKDSAKWYTMTQPSVLVNSKPLFHHYGGPETTTQSSSFAHMFWLGDKSRPFVGIDTPGRGEGVTSVELVHCEDMFNKLHLLQDVDHILILGSPQQIVAGKRLWEMLEVINRNFDVKIRGKSKWEHVSIVHTNANPEDRTLLGLDCWTCESNFESKLKARMRDETELGPDANLIDLFFVGGVATDKDKDAIDRATFDRIWHRINSGIEERASLQAKKRSSHWYCGDAETRAKLAHEQLMFRLFLIAIVLAVFVVSFALPSFAANVTYPLLKLVVDVKVYPFLVLIVAWISPSFWRYCAMLVIPFLGPVLALR